MSVEQWQPIEGWPYEVSSIGAVRRAKSGRLLKPQLTRQGYLKVLLQRVPDYKNMLLHRAVYSSFVGEIGDDLVINHLNGVKTDNRVENLEVCTRGENCHHAALMGLSPSGDRNGARTRPERRPIGSRHGLSKLNEADIPVIRARRAAGESNLRIARDYGVTSGAIYHIIAGNAWKHISHLPTPDHRGTGEAE